jgi:hypothetical protein
MNLFEKLLEFKKIDQQAQDILNELIADAKEYVESNRTLEPGDIVEVLVVDEGEVIEVIGEGVIAQCKNIIITELGHMRKTRMPHSIEYLSKKEDFEERWNTIFYEVFALKKDGKPSAKHFMNSPHYMIRLEDIDGLGRIQKRRQTYAVRLKR